MKYLKRLLPLLLVTSAAAYGSNIEVQELDSVRFEGRCLLVDPNPNVDLGTFNVNPNDNSQVTILAREFDRHGNEVVTSVSIYFAMFDELNLRIATSVDGELTEKVLGAASLSDPEIGNRFRATLPLKLGGTIECAGTILGS